MDLYDSFIRVMWDPDGEALVLVDYGDPLWGPIMLDGEQVVDVVPLVRSAGVKAFPRGNERHQLSFELCRIRDGMDEAFAARMNAAISLPRGMADVLVTLDEDRSWRLKNCAVRSWPGGQEERFTREAISIEGGELVDESSHYEPGQTWGEIALKWENLS